jgi:hypothetical protein
MGFETKEARFQESIRRLASRNVGDKAAIEEAREQVAQHVARLQQMRLPATNNLFITDNDIDDGDDSASMLSIKTEYSRECAVMRGHHLGSMAENSDEDEDNEDHHDDADLVSEYAASSIVTEANTEYTPNLTVNTSYHRHRLANTESLRRTSSRTLEITNVKNSKKKATKFKMKRRKRPFKGSRKGDKDDESSAASNQGVWMCGVCGRAFKTFEACDRHEDWHIQAVAAEFLGTINKAEDSHALSPSRQMEVGGRVGVEKDSFWEGDSVANSMRAKNFKSVRQRLFTEDEAFLATTPTNDFDRMSPVSENLLSMTRRRGWKQNGDDEEEKVEETAASEWPVKQRLHDVRFNDTKRNMLYDDNNDLLGHKALQDYVVLADEALVSVCQRANQLLLTKAEMEAEERLALLARDKAYYDELAERAIARRINPYDRFRTEGDTIRDKIQNKMLDAYQIMKQGDNTRGLTDQYEKANLGNDNVLHAMDHTAKTLYVNVMVKNSVQVVKRELERLAQAKWERPDTAGDENITKFQRFRVHAHANMVKLAGLALASDFTPRRIAIQLSNDLYRLLTPRLKRRGVAIETEIEYRIGPYFVLSVNISSVDWLRLMRANVRDVAYRMKKWKREEALKSEEETTKQRFWRLWLSYVRRLLSVTWFDIFTRALSLLYHVHWIIAIPICWMAYHSPLGATIRMFILSSVTDEIFGYIEEKGMEMEIRVHQANNQASFMLQALREIRAGGQELKKRKETELQDVGVILGNLLGPVIKADKDPAPTPPADFEMPDDLEFVGLQVELPVGFRRLRWALLSDESTFVSEAIFKTEIKYENITIQPWERHSEFIGKVVLPESVKPEAFVGVGKEQQYLMPKSAFVAANMAYETQTIVAYSDNCFCIKKKSKLAAVYLSFTNCFNISHFTCCHVYSSNTRCPIWWEVLQLDYAAIRKSWA